jgi:hypothetical protein
MLLNVTVKDGFNPPMIEGHGRKQIDYSQYGDYAKQWCKDNAGTYRIQRYIYDERNEKCDK